MGAAIAAIVVLAIIIFLTAGDHRVVTNHPAINAPTAAPVPET
jgi:hypothetical protein